MSNGNESTFAAFLADVLGRIDRGEPIDRERLLAEHEELRPRLESFFRGQSLVGELLGRAGLAMNGDARSSSFPGSAWERTAPEALPRTDDTLDPTSIDRIRFADFELLDEIGRGGMGVVYRARQLRPERIVALKMVLAGRHASPTALARFRTEAAAAARLRHPSIVPIHQVGEHDGLAYYVMDLIEGESLDDRLARGPLSPRIAAEMLLELARAVEHAHQQGVIHRDLKPANVLIECGSPQCSPLAPREEPHHAKRDAYTSLNPEPRTLNPAKLYIADFGLARILDSDQGLTATGEAVGTASYMAPEQAGFVGQTFLSASNGRQECLPHEKRGIGPATDVYGLGAILYAMLTGRPPFQAASRDETIAQLKTKDPAPPRSINAAIPRDLETIALKCLQKDPARRYPSAAALGEDLALYLAGKPISARPVGPFERGWRWALRNKAVVTGLTTVGVLLIALVVGGMYLQKRRADESRRAAALYGAQLILRTEHTDGWTDAHQTLIATAAEIRPDEAVRDQFVASLDGVDAQLMKQFEGGSTFSLQFDGTGQRLLIGGTETMPARLWDHKTGQMHKASRTGGGVVAFNAAGTPQQLTVVDEALVLIDITENPTEIRLTLPQSDSRLRVNRERKAVLALAGDCAAAAVEHSDTGPQTVIWNTTSGKMVGALPDISEALALTPDGSLLATAGPDGEVTIWDIANGKSVRNLHNKRIAVHCLNFANDRRKFSKLVRTGDPHNWLLAAGDAGGTITVWDVGLGAPRAFCHGSHYDVYAVAFSADGITLASSGRVTTNVWDSQTGQLLLRVKSHDHSDAVALSADRRRLATCTRAGGGQVSIWELEWDRGQQSLRGLTSQVVRVAFSHDGTLVAALSNDWRIGVWDRKLGQLLNVFEAAQGYTADNSGFVFSLDNRNLACVAGNELRVWDVQSGAARAPSAKLPPGLTDTLAFVAEDRVFVGREETKDERATPGSYAHPTKHPRVYRLREFSFSGRSRLIGSIADLDYDVGAAAMASDGSFLVLCGASGPDGKQHAVNIYDGAANRIRSIPLERALVSHGAHIDPTNERIGFATGLPFLTLLKMPQATPIGTIYEARCLSPQARLRAAYNAGDAGVLLGRSDTASTLVTFDLGRPLPPGYSTFDRSGDLLAWGRHDGTVAVANLERVCRELAKLDLRWLP